MTRPAAKHPFDPHEADLLRHYAAANGNLMLVTGLHTQVAAADTIVTGLATVAACGASFNSDPTVKQQWVSATIGDQAGTPAAGSIIVKSWKATNNTNDTTPTAATDLSENLKMGWWAIGTPAADINDPA